MKKDLLHSGRLGSFATSAANYTSSIDSDSEILDEVVKVNLAHTLSLARSRTIDSSVASSILAALRKVPSDLKLDPQLEDVHSCVEQFVIAKVGSEKGGMLNLAKSRNDQVATALRMAVRTKLIAIGKELSKLEETLAQKALENADVVMPGYTHLQRAQAVTAGHHLLAYCEMLGRNSERVLDCYARVNQSPMGAGALASSSFNPNREEVASLLGFDRVLANSLDSVSSRDFAVESIFVCAQIMNDLSRLAEEIVLWTSTEFSFAEISDAFASTSSMMPQKKNAIVPEIARARASQVFGDLVASLGITKSLPLTYNLDLQELTKNLWSAMSKTLETISIFSELLKGLVFREEEMAIALGDETIFSTEIADYLVRKYGVSFRTAHQRVGALVREIKGKKPFSSLGEAELQKFLGVSISTKEIRDLLDAKKVLASRSSLGSPNPKLVKRASGESLKLALEFSKKFGQLEERLEKSDDTLSKEIDQAMREKNERTARR
jgi:argininosuccinate lyase